MQIISCTDLLNFCQVRVSKYMKLLKSASLGLLVILNTYDGLKNMRDFIILVCFSSLHPLPPPHTHTPNQEQISFYFTVNIIGKYSIINAFAIIMFHMIHICFLSSRAFMCICFMLCIKSVMHTPLSKTTAQCSLSMVFASSADCILTVNVVMFLQGLVQEKAILSSENIH